MASIGRIVFVVYILISAVGTMLIALEGNVVLTVAAGVSALLLAMFGLLLCDIADDVRKMRKAEQPAPVPRPAGVVQDPVVAKLDLILKAVATGVTEETAEQQLTNQKLDALLGAVTRRATESKAGQQPQARS